VDLSDPVFDGHPVNFFLVIAIPKSTFECDELPLLKGPGELEEIAPGVDVVPFGAGLVFSLVVLPALLGCMGIWDPRRGE
jgi:hypothetical protein